MGFSLLWLTDGFGWHRNRNSWRYNTHQPLVCFVLEVKRVDVSHFKAFSSWGPSLHTQLVVLVQRVVLTGAGTAQLPFLLTVCWKTTFCLCWSNKQRLIWNYAFWKMLRNNPRFKTDSSIILIHPACKLILISPVRVNSLMPVGQTVACKWKGAALKRAR